LSAARGPFGSGPPLAPASGFFFLGANTIEKRRDTARHVIGVPYMRLGINCSFPLYKQSEAGRLLSNHPAYFFIWAGLIRVGRGLTKGYAFTGTGFENSCSKQILDSDARGPASRSRVRRNLVV